MYYPPGSLKGLAIVNFCDHYYDVNGDPPEEDLKASRKPYAELLRKLKPAANLIMVKSGNNYPVVMTTEVNERQNSKIKIFQTYHPAFLLRDGDVFHEMLTEVRRFQAYLQSIKEGRDVK